MLGAGLHHRRDGFFARLHAERAASLLDALAVTWCLDGCTDGMLVRVLGTARAEAGSVFCAPVTGKAALLCRVLCQCGLLGRLHDETWGVDFLLDLPGLTARVNVAGAVLLERPTGWYGETRNPGPGFAQTLAGKRRARFAEATLAPGVVLDLAGLLSWRLDPAVDRPGRALRLRACLTAAPGMGLAVRRSSAAPLAE